MKQFCALLYAVLAIAILPALFITTTVGCSPDSEEKEEEVLIPPVPEPIPEPEPSWADGIVEIEIGRHRSGSQLLSAIEEKGFKARRMMGPNLRRRDFPVSNQPGTSYITIVTLLEAGLTEIVTIDEIRERFRELGYRPMTLEEAAELRIQLTDQPDSTKDSELSDMEKRWSYFFVLITEEHAEYLANEGEEFMPTLYRASVRARYGEEFGLGILSAERRIFDPHIEELKMVTLLQDTVDNAGTRFACAIPPALLKKIKNERGK